MNIQQIIIITLAIFFLVGIMLKNKNKNSFEEFSLNRNKLNWFSVSTGISMTFVGGAAIISMAAIGYMFGWDGLIDSVAPLIGLIITTFFIKKYRDNKGITLQELLTTNTNKKLSVYIALITNIFFLLAISAQFVALGKLIGPFFPDINNFIVLIVPAILIFFYVISNGFKSVNRTDMVQWFSILLFLIVPLLLFAFSHSYSIEIGGGFKGFSDLPFDYWFLFSIPIILLPLSQNVNIRVKSAKNKYHARLGLLAGGIFYFIVSALSIFIGIYLAKSGVILDDPERAVYVFFTNNFPIIGSFVIIAVISAIVSTLDSMLLNSITSIKRDILEKIGFFKDNKDKDKVVLKMSAVIVLIITMTVSIYFQEVLALILTALLLYISIILPIVFGKILKLKENIIFWSIILTTVIIIFIEFMKYNISPKTIYYPVIGLIIMLSAFIIDKFVLKRDV